MRRLMVMFIVLQLVNCSCLTGFELVKNGECRGLYVTIPNVQYIDSNNVAISKCKEINAQPVIIHDEEQQNYWTYHSASNSGITLPLGLLCNSTSKKWEWDDGSVVDYKPPSYHADLDANCKSGCAWNVWQNGYWNNACDASLRYTTSFFCTTQLQQPQFSADGCDGFEDDSEDDVCYQIGKTAENWQEAQQICRSFGANLASIHNAKENSFVRRLAVSKGELKGLFLGATISGKGDTFGWIDGSDWDYDNFYSGFPMNGIGNCVVMDTQGVTGEWVNTDCNSSFSVACVRKQHYTEPACLDGPWKEGDVIYSPGFPFDASTPCDFIFTVDVGKKVQLEVLMLEANSCCDHLKLYDNYVGGNLIANLTGEVSEKTFTSDSNFMRVSWQPNGGVNVRGMMITYRAG